MSQPSPLQDPCSLEEDRHIRGFGFTPDLFFAKQLRVINRMIGPQIPQVSGFLLWRKPQIKVIRLVRQGNYEGDSPLFSKVFTVNLLKEAIIPGGDRAAGAEAPREWSHREGLFLS